jgi:tetratricopeptide (TPR) repeat protein
MTRLHYAILFCLLFLPVSAAAQNVATIKEYKKVFKTYPYSDPNPIPMVGKIYPYFRYDLYADKPVEKEWTVVELENDYIKVMILPEIGGKIWAAMEKATGQPFIYYNHVVKFRDIAMRGPWTSGGIEANYGIIGHTPNCATPVDYLTRKNDDGSVSCFIGVLDLLTRTPWRLEINLPADKAFFTTASFWYNATPLEQPYYTWMNAGIKAAGNLQFIYPGTNYLGHSGEYASWPINKDNGKDISFYENNNFGGPKSYHVFGKYTDFFGGYWHDEDFGMARYSPHDDKAGKKIWIWGLSPQGMIWEKLLTDTDGQYVEVQSGRLFNQSAEQSTRTPFKHRGFAPYETDKWTEYWFPVKQTKGFVKANQYGALNVKQGNGELKLYFSPVQNINDKLEVFDGSKAIYSKQLTLKPLETFADTIKASVAADRLRVTLGGNKLEYSADPKTDVLDRPLETPKDFDWDSVYGLYVQGKEDIRQRFYPAAKQKLEACLQKDPNFAPALDDLAMLECRNMNFSHSYELAKKALSIDSYDPAANYVYGLAALQLGKVTDAKDGFDIASMSVEYRSAAFAELSKIYFHENQLASAVEYANKALDFNRYNLDARQMQTVTYRRQNKAKEAADILNQILALDPLNHFARFEKSLWEQSESSRRAFVSLIRNELPLETFLELAIWYDSIGQSKESEAVLQLAPQNAEVAYWLAYLNHKLHGADTAILIQKANASSPYLVFPFRSETAEVLRWAMTQTDAWQPKYYLALIDWSRNDEQQAWALFKACGSAPDYAPFYAARSVLAARLNPPDGTLADLLQATKLDPKQWRYGKSLAEDYAARPREQYDKALQIARSYYEKSPDNYQLGALYAKTLLLNKQYKQTSELLAKLNLLPFEGSTEGRVLYKEAQLMLAVEHLKAGDYAQALHFIEAAKHWPENLGAGKPYPEDVDERLEDWLAALSYEKLNRPSDAVAALNRIAAFKNRRFDANTLVSALALQKLGRQQDAEKLFADWAARRGDGPLLEWAKQVFRGQPTPSPKVRNANDDVNLKVINEWQLIRNK